MIHGRVYTENDKQPWAQAAAIRRAKIVAVGDDAAIEKMRGMGTKVVNAGGKLVLQDSPIATFIFWRAR